MEATVRFPAIGKVTGTMTWDPQPNETRHKELCKLTRSKLAGMLMCAESDRDSLRDQVGSLTHSVVEAQTALYKANARLDANAQLLLDLVKAAQQEAPK